jgi:hypothetical protein
MRGPRISSSRLVGRPSLRRRQQVCRHLRRQLSLSQVRPCAASEGRAPQGDCVGGRGVVGGFAGHALLPAAGVLLGAVAIAQCAPCCGREPAVAGARAEAPAASGRAARLRKGGAPAARERAGLATGAPAVFRERHAPPDGGWVLAQRADGTAGGQRPLAELRRGPAGKPAATSRQPAGPHEGSTLHGRGERAKGLAGAGANDRRRTDAPREGARETLAPGQPLPGGRAAGPEAPESARGARHSARRVGFAGQRATRQPPALVRAAHHAHRPHRPRGVAQRRRGRRMPRLFHGCAAAAIAPRGALPRAPSPAS